MNYNHKAILKVYPNVSMIDDDIGVFDNDGNQIEIDAELVESATIEVLEEENWEYFRNIRNRFLSETDWVLQCTKSWELIFLLLGKHIDKH